MYLFLLQNEIKDLTLLERLKTVAVRTPVDYISEIVGPDLQDGCNLSDDESEDQVEKDEETKLPDSGL